jgi:hypothetical protein
MSFGSNGVDWVRSFRKNQLQVFRLNRGQNNPSGQLSHEFCRAKTKQRKRTKHEFWVKRVDLVRSFEKLNGKFFCFNRGQNCPRGGFGTRFCRPKPKLRKPPNMSFGSNGVDWVRSFQKINYKFFRSTSGQNGRRGRVSHEFVDRN